MESTHSGVMFVCILMDHNREDAVGSLEDFVYFMPPSISRNPVSVELTCSSCRFSPISKDEGMVSISPLDYQD